MGSTKVHSQISLACETTPLVLRLLLPDFETGQGTLRYSIVGVAIRQRNTVVGRHGLNAHIFMESRNRDEALAGVLSNRLDSIDVVEEHFLFLRGNGILGLCDLLLEDDQVLIVLVDVADGLGGRALHQGIEVTSIPVTEVKLLFLLAISLGV